MREDMLEIMIGKYLDGQITASEQRVLETELDNNFQAKEFLEQLQDLHQRTREAVVSEIIDRGKDAEVLFEQAWRHTESPLYQIMRFSGQLRFVAGLAAGLIIGLTLHFILFSSSTPQINQTQPRMVAYSPVSTGMDEARTASLMDNSKKVIRNVDWYTFTDENGNQWLVEGLRENKVKTAAYYEGL